MSKIFQIRALLLIGMLSLFFINHAYALDYDFYQDGLDYKIISEEDRTVSIIRAYDVDSIPDKVIYNDKAYSVIEIGQDAFAYSSLTSITIPNSVTKIGDRAFMYCFSLQAVTIPNSVTTIGDSAFAGSRCLTSVTIPNSVTTIGDSAFAESRLISVMLGKSVKEIGLSVFQECRELECIDVDSENQNYTSYEGILYNKDKTTLISCPGAKKYATIPNSVTTIRDTAFGYCRVLEWVKIPDSVITIGNDAFRDCESLQSVTIGKSVITIGNYAFYYCESLKSVKIPDSVITIGNDAFRDCHDLASVTISNSVTTIGDNAFNYCKSLKSVKIPDSVTTIGDSAFEACSRFTSIEIPNSVITIGDSAFESCESLQSVTIGNSVTTIGNDTFRDCYALKSVTIPNSVTTIGDSAFSECEALESVTLGTSVTRIGNDAFQSCINLKSICNLSITPLECNPNFPARVFKNASLYVPVGTLEAYQNVSPWLNFWNIEEKDYSGIEDVFLNETPLYNIYNMNGVEVLKTDVPEKINMLPPGIYVVNGKKMVIK